MRIAYLFIALSLCLSSVAQEYSFIQYNVEEGLPHSQVRSLLVDDQGLLWIGTLGGLSRFDGENFRNYSTVDGLTSNQINVLCQRADGSLWIGAKGAVSTLFNHSFRHHVLPEQFADVQVSSLFEDVQGVFWIGTEKGLLRWSDGAFEVFLEGENIKRCFSYKQELWAVSKSQVWRQTEGKFESVDARFPKGKLMDAALRGNRLVLASSGDGLLTYGPLSSGKKGVLRSEYSQIPSNRLNGVLVDDEKNLWIRSNKGLAYWTNNGRRIVMDASVGLEADDVRAMVLDKSGKLWLGTNGGGLYKFTGQEFVTFTERSGLGSSLPMTMTNDTQGNLWVGSFDAGLTQMLPDTNRYFHAENALPNNKIWTSTKDSNGQLWFGSSEGLIRWNGLNFRTFDRHDNLPHPKVLSVAEVDNKLWIGTNKGLATLRFLDDSITHFEGVPRVKVRSICAAGEQLYAGTVAGVYRIDLRSGVSELVSPMGDFSVSALACDKESRLWVGGSEGLMAWDGSEKRTFLLDKTARANQINFLLVDKSSTLWVGTNNGIYNASLKNGLDDLQWRHFTRHDGISSLETNLNAAFEDKNGVLWFGTSEGLVRHKPKPHSQIVGAEQQVVLTNVQLNLEETDWSALDSTVHSISGLPSSAVVDYKFNHFTFHFSTAQLTDPNQKEYSYMLEGLDKDWQPSTREGRAVYSNLPYSDFVFKVRARSGKGDWGEATAFPFEINPPFWRTWWFMLAVSLVVVYLGYKIFQTRRNNLLTQLENEKLHYRSRMLKLEQQTLNSSLNRHFIFNALNSIQYYVNRQDRRSANTYLSSFAKLIRKNLDSSQHNFTTLAEELERLRLYLDLEQMRFQGKFEYQIDVEPGLALEEVKIPAMLLQPFLENSIWHGILPGKEMGVVRLEARKQDDQTIGIKVIDNGIGIKTSLANKPDAPDGHISQGMQITNNRINLMQRMTAKEVRLNGPEEWLDEHGDTQGTVVEIIIPMDLHEMEEPEFA